MSTENQTADAIDPAAGIAMHLAAIEAAPVDIDDRLWDLLEDAGDAVTIYLADRKTYKTHPDYTDVYGAWKLWQRALLKLAEYEGVPYIACNACEDEVA